MAEIAYTIDRKSNECHVVTWANVTESDTFKTFTFSGLPMDISVHASDTFGGATLVFKVANDGGTGVDATDVSNTAISLTAEGIKSVSERPLTIKPTASGGTSQSLDVNMVIWYSPE